jgi:signal peptidase II
MNFSLIIAGVFGNVVDRVFRGYTIDFIPIKISSFEAYYNVADIFLWVGICYFIYCIFKYEDLIWHPDNSRNRFLVFPREQFKFALKVSLSSLMTSIMIGLFSITFIKSFYSIYGGRLFEYIATFIILALLFSFCIFLVGLLVSHKTAGPLFAFKLHFEKIMNDHDSKDFKLRDGDNYKELEILARELKEFIDKK